MAGWRILHADCDHIVAHGDKGRGGTFFLHSVLQGDRYPLLFGEWTFPWGELGEMLDECKERHNETVSFVFLNLENNSRFVLNFLNPA